MDYYVGEIFRLLEREGFADSTLIILAGDHGEAFGEHKETDGHTIFGYEENIRVPLIFWSAKGFPRGLTVMGRSSLMDIMPTVLDFADLKSSPFIQGKSLIPLLNGRRAPSRDFYFETEYFHDVLNCTPLHGIISDAFKFIDLPKPELYDLDADKGEKNNVAAADSSRAVKLRDSLASLEKALAGSGWVSGRSLSAEEKKRLESLGYLSSAGQRSKGPECDPKDKIDYWNKSLLAQELIKEKKDDEAEALLRALVDEDPHFIPVVEDLGDLYFARRKADRLEELFNRAIAQNPQSAALRISLAGFLVRLDRASEAVAQLQAAEPLSTPDETEMLYFTLASAYGRMGKYEEAVSFFRKVLEIEPENFEAARLAGFTLMELRRFSEALTYFRLAEKGIPQDPRLLEYMAMTYAELKDFDAAKRYFEKTVSISPSAVVYANYALACAETGNYARAIVLMQTAIGRPDASPDLQSSGRRYLADWALKK
jgi:tetratricopeptide (TPR) repeat protein